MREWENEGMSSDKNSFLTGVWLVGRVGRKLGEIEDFIGEGWEIQKISERFGRGLREILVKKGCKMGGVSL